MKPWNTIIKLVSVLVAAACVIFYQHTALERAALAAENEAQIAEAESYNAEIMRQIEEAERAAKEGETEDASEETTSAGPFTDGTYEGQGTGYGGMITVSVRVEGGYISEIIALDHSTEDPAYYMLAETVLKRMADEQSADVDTVSGATLSSGGLIQAVADALSKAQ